MSRAPVENDLHQLTRKLRAQNRSYRGQIIAVTGQLESVGEMMRFANDLRAEGLTVTCVDCFISDPMFPRPWGSRAKQEGLVDAVRYGSSHDHVTRSVDGNGFHVIGPGSAWPDTEGVLSDERFRALMTELSFESDVVLVMAPTEMAGILSAESDRVVVLRHAGKKRRAGRSEVEKPVTPGKAESGHRVEPPTRRASARSRRIRPVHIALPLLFVAIVVSGLMIGKQLRSSGSGEGLHSGQAAGPESNKKMQPTEQATRQAGSDAAGAQQGSGNQVAGSISNRENNARSASRSSESSLAHSHKTVPPVQKYRVYTGSFRTLHSAEAQLARLSGKGFEASIREVDLGDQGIWYRVFLIPLYSSSEVDSIRTALTDMGLGEPYLSKARMVDGG